MVSLLVGSLKSQQPDPSFPYVLIKKPLSIFINSGPSLGSVLLSQDPSVQVPSALEGLTFVFGMGTRGSLPPLSPNLGDVSAKKHLMQVQGDLLPENRMRNEMRYFFYGVPAKYSEYASQHTVTLWGALVKSWTD